MRTAAELVAKLRDATHDLTLKDRAELFVLIEALQQDAAFLDWLEKHPRHAQIYLNGETKDCVLYGVSCSDMMPIREVLRKVIGDFKEGKP